ncbi:hypothetical protein H2201_004654 [Coniosporium apollinis]|uniref:Cupin type-1 domain-containing protein n=1 Tax=Coniosporium apollinis TaxID=61459 RepID=A0ABQ9NS16_9PEZI|nr:hypothetical protein H2201_004654 [Coniosporium apollinis]
MASVIARIIVAALAAGAVNALPQPVPSSATTTLQPVPSTTAAPAPAQTDFSALISELQDAPTAIDRYKKLFTSGGALLPRDELQKRVVFDFNGATPANGAKGGALKAANIATFPVLTSLGISTTMGFLNACGINTPHTHPRATEFLTVVDGALDFGFIVENGLVAPGNSAEVTGHIARFQGAVFPVGSIHYQFNNQCEPATFVASLNNEDPGTSQVAQNFFGLNGGVVAATLGFPDALDGADIESFRALIPANVALDVEGCLARCGIPKR